MKIHFHSDCAFFAGCENMLAVFLNSDTFREEYDVSFSYRYTEAYRRGLMEKVAKNFPEYPVNLPELPLPPKSNGFMNNFLPKISFITKYFFLLYPLYIYDVCILYRLFKRINPSILHINNGGYPGALSARAAATAGWLLGIKKIFFVVNNQAVGYRKPTRVADFLLDRFVKISVSCFFTGSDSARIRLCNVLGLPENKVIKIHNGIQLKVPDESVSAVKKRLAVGEFNGVLIGTVAILRPNKGHIFLLEAIKKIKMRNSKGNLNIRVLIEGDGPLLEDLRTFARNNQIEAECCFLGVERNIANFFQILDIFVLPSIESEDLPNVISEAMGFGIPVIASNIAGIPEQVEHGITGYLVDPGDSEALAKYIETLAGSSAMRKEMGSASQNKFGNQFRANNAVDQYSSLYREY
jgi:L-malate glycosyltransferase